MGRQSARIWFNGKDHKEVYYNGNYHKAIFMNGNIVWEKLANVIDTNINVSEKYSIGYTLHDHLFLFDKPDGNGANIVYRYNLIDGIVKEEIIQMPPLETPHPSENFNCGVYYYRYADRVYYTIDHNQYLSIPFYLTYSENYNPDGTGAITKKTYEFATFSENYAWYKETTAYSGTSNIIRCRPLLEDVTIANRYVFQKDKGWSIYGTSATNIEDSILTYGNSKYRIFNGQLLPNVIDSNLVDSKVPFYYEGNAYFGFIGSNEKTLSKIDNLGNTYSYQILYLPSGAVSTKYCLYGNYLLFVSGFDIYVYNLVSYDYYTIPIASNSKELGFYYINNELYYVYGRRENNSYYLSLLKVEV